MSESSGKEPTPEDRYLKKMRGIIRSHTHQERMNALFLRIKARLPELVELARDLEEAEEDGVYRFYHGSNKVFFLQDPVMEAFTLIKEDGRGRRSAKLWVCANVEAGTAHQFSETTNENWEAETKPILDAFWHTKYFINMMVKYAKELEKVESPLEPGMAAVLYLFELRWSREIGRWLFPKVPDKEITNVWFTSSGILRLRSADGAFALFLHFARVADRRRGGAFAAVILPSWTGLKRRPLYPFRIRGHLDWPTRQVSFAESSPSSIRGLGDFLEQESDRWSELVRRERAIGKEGEPSPLKHSWRADRFPSSSSEAPISNPWKARNAL
jgi:hypothetical protein